MGMNLSRVELFEFGNLRGVTFLGSKKSRLETTDCYFDVMYSVASTQTLSFLGCHYQL